VLLSARGLRWYPLMAAGHLARMADRPAEASRRYREARAVLEEIARGDRVPMGLPSALAVTIMLIAQVEEDPALAREALERARLADDAPLVRRVGMELEPLLA